MWSDASQTAEILAAAKGGDELLGAQVAVAMKLIGMRRPLAVYAIPTAAVLLDRIDVSGILYYVKDNYSSYHEPLRFSNIVEHDRLLLEKADAIVCASVSLWEEYRTRYRNVHWVPHGVSRIFLDAPAAAEPLQIPDIPHPRIIYWGLIDRQIDTALIMDLDVVRQNIQFMMRRLSTMKAKLRPHVKCQKSPELARLQVQAGAIGV